MTTNPPRRPPAPPGPKRWTRKEYYRLARLGFFDGQRVERIGGELMVMGRQSWPHTRCLAAAFELLSAVFRPGFWVRNLFPLELGPASDPEPDVSVVAGSVRDYSAHPTTAVLIVEVAHTSLRLDRGRKAQLYAAAGVPDYWVVDVVGRRVEVCRDPRPDPTARFGARYAARAWLTPADAITPLAAPAAAVPVAALFG